MLKRLCWFPLALASMALAAPAPVLAQDSTRAAEHGGSSKKKKSSKKAKRSFSRETPAEDRARPAPTTTENALSVTPNVPGSGEDEPTAAREQGERPETN